jgi:hypothetical protein
MRYRLRGVSNPTGPQLSPYQHPTTWHFVPPRYAPEAQGHMRATHSTGSLSLARRAVRAISGTYLPPLWSESPHGCKKRVAPTHQRWWAIWQVAALGRLSSTPCHMPGGPDFHTVPFCLAFQARILRAEATLVANLGALACVLPAHAVHLSIRPYAPHPD